MRKTKRSKHKKSKNYYRQTQDLSITADGVAKTSKSFKDLHKEGIPLVEMLSTDKATRFRGNFELDTVILDFYVVDPADMRDQYPLLPQDQPETTEDS